MPRTFLYPYNRNSRGARLLSRSLGIKRIRTQNSRFRGAPRKVLNWGSTYLPPRTDGCKVVNPPELVALCTNKLRFFQAVDGMCSVPEWTTDANVARQWVTEGKTAVARTLLNGRGGQGIVLIEDPDDMVEAPLYTKYVNKKDEYRVHVVNGKVVDLQRKALRRGTNNPNWSVRSHDNGFVFIRGGVQAPECVKEEALKAMDAVGLDFGAVDVIYNERKAKAYVLEINTAPGLEGTTLETYRRELSEQIHHIR